MNENLFNRSPNLLTVVSQCTTVLGLQNPKLGNLYGTTESHGQSTVAVGAVRLSSHTTSTFGAKARLFFIKIKKSSYSAHTKKPSLK